MRRRRWLLRIGASIVLIVIIASIGFAAWGANGYPPSAEAVAAMQSDGDVSITDAADLITFTPKAAAPTVGFIFYPGARVLPAAYAPYMRDIAKAGYAAFVVKMPINFAIFGINRADGVITANPAIKAWAISGHSLGGSMAAQYVAGSDKVQGLVFWASYSASDLSKKSIKVLSIFGSLDGLVKKDIAANAQKLLPADARIVTIEGGDHAYFGWYGPQDGDNPATIPHEQAATQITAATVELLKTITP